MSKEYFTENLSIEDIAEMTDEMLRFENSVKIGGNIKARLFKIIPAIAAIVLVIGLINIMPVIFENTGTDVSSASTDVLSETETSTDLNVYINAAESTNFTTENQITSTTDYTINNYVGESNEDNNKVELTIDYEDIENIMYLMKQSEVDKFVKEEHDRNGMKNLPRAIWYLMSENAIGEVMIKEQAKNGLKNIPEDIWYFMSQNAIDEIIVKEHERNGLKNIPQDVWYLMSENAIGEVMIKEHERNGFENIPEDVWYFMNQSAIDEIARTEYNKNGFKNFPEVIFVCMSGSIANELVTDENSEYWDRLPWIRINNGNVDTFTLKNGTKIETVSQYHTFASLMTNNSSEKMYAFIKPVKSSTIKLANGIAITAPGGTTIKATPVKDADHILEITIGRGGATIIQPDGTSATVPTGTIIDGEGNITK